jgi:hypothetical protein
VAKTRSRSDGSVRPFVDTPPSRLCRNQIERT